MATKYPKFLLTCPYAEHGDKTIPPYQGSETGYFSQDEGFKKVNAMPIGEGGIPPHREDFNGTLYVLSQLLFWFQQGGLMTYSASTDYEAGNEILFKGVKYRALVDNGPNTEKQAVTPGTDPETWRNMDFNVPAGMIVPFANVTLGGSDNRRPIFWGAKTADESWVLCDGGDDGIGGNVPDLRNKFIRGGEVSENGQSGGEDSKDISLNLSGTTGGHAITIEEMPNHNHGASGGAGQTSTAGAHTHTRGTMNITGRFGADDRASSLTDGCFSRFKHWETNTSASGGDDDFFGVAMNAANSWVGNTSESGNHTHSVNVSIQAQGGGREHTHSVSLGGTSTSFLTVPVHLKFAFFVRVPETAQG